MKAEVTVTVSHDGTAKALIATVNNPADKEFNNTVTPPEEPKFQPEKYVVAAEKYDITGDKLLDDDKEQTSIQKQILIHMLIKITTMKQKT